jgi:hypothetical protein
MITEQIVFASIQLLEYKYNLKENTPFYIHDPDCFSLTSFLCSGIMFKSQSHDDNIFIDV